MEPILPFSFTDFPEGVKSRILSFLSTSELATFGLTSKHFLSFCRHDQKLWFFKCEHRWGSKTKIKKWGSGKISYRNLYRKLEEYENIIGFWRSNNLVSFDLVWFEWGPFYITCSTILPAKRGSYGVIKKPFLWMTLTSQGEVLNYLDLEGEFPLTENDVLMEDSEKLRCGLILINVTVEAGCDLRLSEDPLFFEFRKRVSARGMVGDCENVYKALPDSLMSEIRRCFANKEEKEKQGTMRRWESGKYFKIEYCSATPTRPFQGLWKGTCHDKSLDFYHAHYSDSNNYDCTRIGGSLSTPLFHHPDKFVSFYANFTEPPFSREDDDIYNSLIHFDPSISDNEDVTGTLDIVSIPAMWVGRLWRHANGNFGLGFEGNNQMIDLIPMVKDGQLLDLIDS